MQCCRWFAPPSWARLDCRHCTYILSSVRRKRVFEGRRVGWISIGPERYGGSEYACSWMGDQRTWSYNPRHRQWEGKGNGTNVNQEGTERYGWVGQGQPQPNKCVPVKNHHCLEEHLETLTAPPSKLLRLHKLNPSVLSVSSFFLPQNKFWILALFCFPPSSGIPRSVGQVWIDGSGNDFIISPSCTDWPNCRRIFTILPFPSESPKSSFIFC